MVLLIKEALRPAFQDIVDSLKVVYNWGFFAESHQAKQHRRDVTLYAVIKSRTWVTAGSFLE